MKVPKQKCVGGPHNLSDEQLSKWKRQLLENAATLFEPTDKQSDASAERIAQLEQLVGRLTLALDIQKKPWVNTQAKTLGWVDPDGTARNG